jgi:uncharacterized HhH-GPD family protein
MQTTTDNNNLAFKCTWNDSGFKGICSQPTYQYNLSKKRAWCTKAHCRSFKGKPTDENHPCYESILFTEWRFGAGWDHKNEERPREIKKAKVGEIALLTTLEPDKEEDERKIIGFLKIGKIDKGEEKETVIYGNPSESLEIDSEIKIKFWDYYANPNAPDKHRWGTGLFRYIDDRIILNFLKDLKELYIKNDLSDIDIQKISESIAGFENISPHAPLHIPKKAEKKPAIADENDKKICSYCGHANSYKAKFCNECGKGFVLECGQCKTINPPGSKYCSECSTKLDSTPQYSPEIIRDKLLEFGTHLMNEPREYYFTPDKEADKLILKDSNAFLFAVIFDQGIGAEKAWAAPYELKKRMGHLDIKIIAGLSEDDIGKYLQQKPKLHRFWPTMARRLKKACSVIQEEYNGEAKNIWNDKSDSRIVYERLKSFDGIGQKKASMAVNILYRDLGVEIKNKSGIDVSYDEMVRRIFLRTGIVNSDTLNNVINAARKLHPEYPGELDYPAWYIGRTWCLPKNPKCNKCYLEDVCQRVVI